MELFKGVVYDRFFPAVTSEWRERLKGEDARLRFSAQALVTS
jgi:hypothetical protein